MKALFAILCLLVASCDGSLADTIQVNLSGNLGLLTDTSSPYYGSDPGFWNSSVSRNGTTPYTLNFTFNSAATSDPNLSTPNDPYYDGGNYTLEFGTYTLQGSADILMRGENQADIYLTLATVGNRQLESTFFLTPNTSFQSTSISDLQSLTLSDLNASESSFLGTFDGVGNGEDPLSGTITGYSVADLSAPEPSTWTLLLGDLGLLAFWHRRTRRA